MAQLVPHRPAPPIPHKEALVAATLFMSNGNYAEALPLLDQVLADSPNNYDGIKSKAMCLSALGRPAEALELLRKAALLWPEDAELSLVRGVAMMAAGKWEEALVAVTKATRADPASYGAAEARAFDDAYWLHPSAQKAAFVLHRQAAINFRLGRLQQALALADRSLEASPKDPEARALRALVLSQLGRPAEAKEDIAKAFDAQPGHLPSKCCLAFIALNEEKWSDALATADEVLAVQSDVGDLKIIKAEALIHLGQPDAAFALLAEVSDENADQYPAAKISELYRMLGKPKEAAAAANYLWRKLSTREKIVTHLGLRLPWYIAGVGAAALCFAIYYHHRWPAEGRPSE